MVKIEKAPFGILPNGDRATLYTLRDQSGFAFSVTDFGAAVVSIFARDMAGTLADVVLGYDSAEQYASGRSFFGATIGRYGNRIAGGKFELGGEKYNVPLNNGKNHLHGGPGGFHTKMWTGSIDATRSRIVFTRTSPDGEEHYPGNLGVTVTYALTAPGVMQIGYRASTDKSTPVNLTNHSYFNLAGHSGGPILGHLLSLNASRFTPVDSGLIPTGELLPVAGTAFDFREPVPIGKRIEDDDEQLRFGLGYDHNFVLEPSDSLRLAAVARDPVSGRMLEILTSEPAIQFYSGNFLGSEIGKGGVSYLRRSGFCLETQHFPDSPNHRSFPSTILHPGAHFESATIWRFTAPPSAA